MQHLLSKQTVYTEILKKVFKEFVSTKIRNYKIDQKLISNLYYTEILKKG